MYVCRCAFIAHYTIELHTHMHTPVGVFENMDISLICQDVSADSVKERG